MSDTDTSTTPAENTEPVDADQVDGTENPTDPDGADQLGDAGKKALDAMKAERRELKSLVRDLRAQLEAATKPAAKDTDTPDADAIRKAALSEATKAANARILKSEIKAAAAGKFADPADVFRFLDTDSIDIDADGNVDEGDLNDAIEDLLKSKPYLAAGTPKRFQGSADGGTRNGGNGPSQLTKADLAGMSPSEISKARKEGRLNALLGRG